MTAPLVACTTPTLDRPETHESLYKTFSGQDYDRKVLLVLDESKEPSPFFTQLQDPIVQYMHEPMVRGEVTRIGATRNRLCELARRSGAAFVAHMDDDDDYGKTYLSTMLAKLGDADLVKLAVFRLLVDGGEAKGTLWQWDVRDMNGQHYGLKGSEPPQGPIEVTEDEIELYAHAVRWGFGFSYVYRLALWERFQFPEEGTEDYPWLRTCMENGAHVVEVDDFVDGCLHVVHEGSGSVNFPQVYLGKQAPGVGSEPRSLRSVARWRMLGAVQSMYELPQGKDFAVEPGVTYNVVATVKNSNTLKSVSVRASSFGVTVQAARDNVDPGEFGVKPAAKGYRLVHVVATSSKRTKMPWKTNRLIAMFDKSSLVRAWADRPVAGAGGVAGFRRPPQVQINVQLTPGFGSMPTQQDCPICRHYAWDSTFMRPVNAIDGTPHHPSCSRLSGLAPTKMERRIQRMQARLTP